MQQTAAGVGVPIFPAIIDRMYAHVVEHMLFMACSRFLRALLTQAVQEVGQGRSQPPTGRGCLFPCTFIRPFKTLSSAISSATTTLSWPRPLQRMTIAERYTIRYMYVIKCMVFVNFS